MQEQFKPTAIPKTGEPPTVQEALRILRRAAEREGLDMYADMSFGPYRSRYEIHLNERLGGKKGTSNDAI